MSKVSSGLEQGFVLDWNRSVYRLKLLLVSVDTKVRYSPELMIVPDSTQTVSGY